MYCGVDRQEGRIAWIDCAKGFAILLVIIGHSSLGGNLAEKAIIGAIFSFHMPLFFILSGMTFKCSRDYFGFFEKMRKSFRHLVVPAIIVYLIKVLIEIAGHYSEFGAVNYCKTFVIKKLLTLLFFSGASFTVAGTEITMIGMPWFLMVLFLVRVLFDFLSLIIQGRLLMVVCAAISVAGVVVGRIQWLPFSFDIALAALLFFFIGNYLKTICVEDKSLLKAVGYFMVWFLLLLLSCSIGNPFFSLASRKYSNYPISYAIAVAGTMVVAEVSVLCVRLGKPARPFLFLGKDSLYMLLVHYMDYLWKPLWNIWGNDIVSTVVRVILDIIVFMALIGILQRIRKRKFRKGR